MHISTFMQATSQKISGMQANTIKESVKKWFNLT